MLGLRGGVGGREFIGGERTEWWGERAVRNGDMIWQKKIIFFCLFIIFSLISLSYVIFF